MKQVLKANTKVNLNSIPWSLNINHFVCSYLNYIGLCQPREHFRQSEFQASLSQPPLSFWLLSLTRDCFLLITGGSEFVFLKPPSALWHPAVPVSLLPAVDYERSSQQAPGNPYDSPFSLRTETVAGLQSPNHSVHVMCQNKDHHLICRCGWKANVSKILFKKCHYRWPSDNNNANNSS